MGIRLEMADIRSCISLRGREGSLRDLKSVLTSWSSFIAKVLSSGIPNPAMMYWRLWRVDWNTCTGREGGGVCVCVCVCVGGGGGGGGGGREGGREKGRREEGGKKGSLSHLLIDGGIECSQGCVIQIEIYNTCKSY